MPRRWSSIAVTPANPSIAKGLTEQFTATGTYTDDSTQISPPGDLGLGHDLGGDHHHRGPGHRRWHRAPPTIRPRYGGITGSTAADRESRRWTRSQ